MRSILCLLVVCLFATTAAAQFGAKGAAARNAAPAADTTQKKAVNSKGPAKKAGAAEQAGVEAEVIDAILVAMDLDHDGVVSQKEMTKTLAALRKVAKDKQGNITVPENAGANPNAAPVADAGQGPGGAGAPAGANQRNDNEAMARFMQYDKNGDGVLSENEVPPQARAMLRGADLNGDGVLNAAELQAFSRKMGDRMKAAAAGVNPNGAGGPQGNGRPPKQ